MSVHPRFETAAHFRRGVEAAIGRLALAPRGDGVGVSSLFRGADGRKSLDLGSDPDFCCNAKKRNRECTELGLIVMLKMGDLEASARYTWDVPALVKPSGVLKHQNSRPLRSESVVLGFEGGEGQWFSCRVAR